MERKRRRLWGARRKEERYGKTGRSNSLGSYRAQRWARRHLRMIVARFVERTATPTSRCLFSVMLRTLERTNDGYLITNCSCRCPAVNWAELGAMLPVLFAPFGVMCDGRLRGVIREALPFAVLHVCAGAWRGVARGGLAAAFSIARWICFRRFVDFPAKKTDPY
eukprot:998504-Rhodomonas_salina.1